MLCPIGLRYRVTNGWLLTGWGVNQDIFMYLWIINDLNNVPRKIGLKLSKMRSMQGFYTRIDWSDVRERFIVAWFPLWSERNSKILIGLKNSGLKTLEAKEAEKYEQQDGEQIRYLTSKHIQNRTCAGCFTCSIIRNLTRRLVDQSCMVGFMIGVVCVVG